MISAVPYFICRYCQQCQSTRHRHRAFSTTLCNWLPARNSSYYDLLGIKPEASLEEIKQAFFSKSKKLHPDSDPANPDLHSQFVKLNEAYRVLSKEGSRRRYDNLRGAQAAWTPPGSHSAKGSPFDFADFRARRRPEPNENVRYWQQFHEPPVEPTSRPEAKKRFRRTFGYCLLIMLGSLTVHYVGFRKLEEVHNSFMDEKDRAITQIYNENKERARSMGLQKQQELLRQKHAEFSQRYHSGPEQLHKEPGALDSVQAPAPPNPTGPKG
ncbi:dnaJ homolog subfamily C member 4 isoform X3 [Anolis carolinensis]|uniref:DnaJ heat shock protein family (Hsp40) member C4 n=1 Tax=Anolis carolinensis TaxID=28377 RepID=A0A803TI91_ANOCA|nr:PREDICTED: dnaJ homolog subfamily C member 4 isoform X2 [Anolis carolinensis]|eukprot:XP_008119592.1 PREDICTED: dnaJ homolog subfamily C member 4 isoform X2 [Anolis carolinensis]